MPACTGVETEAVVGVRGCARVEPYTQIPSTSTLSGGVPGAGGTYRRRFLPRLSPSGATCTGTVAGASGFTPWAGSHGRVPFEGGVTDVCGADTFGREWPGGRLLRILRLVPGNFSAASSRIAALTLASARFQSPSPVLICSFSPLSESPDLLFLTRCRCCCCYRCLSLFDADQSSAHF